MSTPKQYLPILKGKRGESGALKNLAAQHKANLMPVIEVQPISMKYEGEPGDPKGPKCTLEEHVEKIAEKIESVWGSASPICIDLLHLEEYGALADGTHSLTYVF